MSKLESAPMLKLAWVPLFSGMTLQGGQAACPPTPFIPSVMAEPCFAWTAGTHASLRLRSVASESQPAEMWVLGTSPRMTVECAAIGLVRPPQEAAR
jgi:hypothetical protein